MDLFALPDQQVEGRQFYSLLGVGAADVEEIRRRAREWLDGGLQQCKNPDFVQRLTPCLR